MSTNTTKPSITAIIIAKDEEQMIANCLDTLRWCDDMIVVDSGSSDRTAQLAEAAGARVIGFSHPSFAKLREEGLKRAKTDWVIYVDADERVTPVLAREIMVKLETSPEVAALRMNREYYSYGKLFQHGGWEKDYVTRVFRRDKLKGWFGKIHESPEFEGELATLKTPLIHLTHRNTVDGLKKSAQWTPIEAELLHQAKVKPVTLLTLIRKGVMEFLRRGIFKRGYKDGMEGWIEALVQGMNRIWVYIQVWELQRKPSLPETYDKLEQKIAQQWKKNS